MSSDETMEDAEAQCEGKEQDVRDAHLCAVEGGLRSAFAQFTADHPEALAKCAKSPLEQLMEEKERVRVAREKGIKPAAAAAATSEPSPSKKTRNV